LFSQKWTAGENEREPCRDILTTRFFYFFPLPQPSGTTASAISSRTVGASVVVGNFFRILDNSGFKDEKSQGDLTFQITFNSKYRTLGHIRIGGYNLFHPTSGKTMTGNIDNIIRPAHDEAGF
jgi:hypothetical protein